MGLVTEESKQRALRHAGEVLVVIAVASGLSLLGVFPREVPLWVVPTVIVVGAGVIVSAYTRWGRDADVNGVANRITVQAAMLALMTYSTGWGFALPLVHLFAVADNVKYSGSRSVRPAVLAAATWTVAGQLMLSFGVAPSIHERVVDTWAIAGFMLLAVTVVAARIKQMTSARESAEAELRSSERRFRSLVEDSSDVVLVMTDGVITYQSPSAERVLGHGFADVDGSSYLGWVHPEDRERVVAQVLELLDEPGQSKIIECRIRHADGHWITAETSTRNLSGDDLVGGFVVNLRDISERKSLEAQLEHRAFHDALTGLPNRALFRNRVEHAVAKFERSRSETAVLYIDLDGFKVINDTLGHAAGDAVLAQVAERIGEVVRVSDTAARLGGDEFAILLEDYQQEDGPARVAERLLEALRRPMVVADAEVDVDASVGIAMHRDEWSAEELTRNADIAMYMAKSAGKGCFEIFEPAMHVAVIERLTLERDLQRGIDNGEFVLHYQPIVELDDKRVVGVEALVRWIHPERGMVSPGTFIPLAEDTGMIIPLGRWVLMEACRQMVDWQTRFPSHPSLHVSINVSMRQLSHGDVVADVRDALRSSGIDPTTVTLELTESALVHDTERTIAVLRQLKGLGVRLAIDDFGTGYSSLAYLQRFPLDVLKIDRSFVEGMVNGTQSPALVRAIIDMSRSLDLETVAEGIEHDEELHRVRALHCNLGQGYLFARPAGSAEVEAIIAGAARAAEDRVIVLPEVQQHQR